MSSPSPPEAEPYFAPRAPHRGEIRDKGSRFLGVVLPVSDETEATAALERLHKEHRRASHHCWAWRLGRPARERSSDAGEPAGTAGQPILQTLRGADLSDALVVVVRWFGGTKLGKGGLARAYAAAAKAALEGVDRIERIETVVLEVSLPYEQVGSVKRLLDVPRCHLLSESYGETVRMELSIAVTDLGRLEDAMADLGQSVSVRRKLTRIDERRDGC